MVGYTILLADDDYYFRKILLSHFTLKRQFTTIAVSDGDTAISALKSGTIDIAIIDFHLPKKKADEILCTVYSNDIAVPVIVVTGDESIETERLVRSNGAYYFFVKPVDLSDIDLVINGLISRKIEAIHH